MKILLYHQIQAWRKRERRKKKSKIPGQSKCSTTNDKFKSSSTTNSKSTPYVIPIKIQRNKSDSATKEKAEYDDFEDFNIYTLLNQKQNVVNVIDDSPRSNHTLDLSSSPGRLVIDSNAPSPVPKVFSKQTEKPYEQPSFSNEMEYKQSTPVKHDRKKSTEVSVSCEQCGEEFANQNMLTDHILEEHDSDPFG